MNSAALWIKFLRIKFSVDQVRVEAGIPARLMAQPLLLISSTNQENGCPVLFAHFAKGRELRTLRQRLAGTTNAEANFTQKLSSDPREESAIPSPPTEPKRSHDREGHGFQPCRQSQRKSGALAPEVRCKRTHGNHPIHPTGTPQCMHCFARAIPRGCAMVNVLPHLGQRHRTNRMYRTA